MERTLVLIKPDGVERNLIGEIIKRFETAGFKIIGLKMLHLNKKKAEAFYAVHQGKPFFEELTEYMSSGPIVAMVLEGKNAVSKVREIMGATDPKEAAPGTIRADLALSKGKNTVHGSDSPENATIEIAFFFGQHELI
ncbi:MAG: nucleoside-diphosphate kinase [Candidatus Desulfofervidus auxilii]|nr:nucleoside-diphosphate kinase [Candidatus Desulfofervidus auxilii]